MNIIHNHHFLDQEKKRYVGIRLASGQDILCQQLILDPSYEIPPLDMPSDAPVSNLPRKVARGICIISSSVRQDTSNVLVVFPPKCKYSHFSLCLWLDLGAPEGDILLLFFDIICFLHFSTRRGANYCCSGASVEQQFSSMPSWNVSFFSRM